MTNRERVGGMPTPHHTSAELQLVHWQLVESAVGAHLANVAAAAMGARTHRAVARPEGWGVHPLDEVISKRLEELGYT
jgi:hypothetical protein